MPNSQPWKNEGMNKPDWVAKEVARAVGAGKKSNVEAVDYSDPNRPLTCLEVDFPIVPVNEIAALESSSGAAKKPIYQMAKWWARRQSSIFRAMLLAATHKCPADSSSAAQVVWNSYYKNHQPTSALMDISVADIFMGGGTTIVEGLRLGHAMSGVDLNPVAWFVVKAALSDANPDTVEAAINQIDRNLKNQLMPFYACDCPRGHKGIWTEKSSGKTMGEGFDPLSISPANRDLYEYRGPEIIYSFWAKHGPCSATGCGHRTPIFTKPVIAARSLSVNYWNHKCKNCGTRYHIEEQNARLAPSEPFVLGDDKDLFSVATLDGFSGTPSSVKCPSCTHEEGLGKLGRAKRKKVDLSLLIHPMWLRGTPATDAGGQQFGGCADDLVVDTINWNNARAKDCSLIEVRGALPSQIVCPVTGMRVDTGKDGGTVPKKSSFVCMADTCGQVHDVLSAVKASKKNGPVAPYSHQGYCPTCAESNMPYGGRFFIPASDSRAINAAIKEWNDRKDLDLNGYWPKSEIPYGFMTSIANGDIREGHGFTHWWKMFNPRQLLVHAQILKSIMDLDSPQNVKDIILAAFQQYLRFNCMFTVYHPRNDQATKHFANNNFHPRSTLLEVSVFGPMGDGRWTSACGAALNSIRWSKDPWELATKEEIGRRNESLKSLVSGKSEKVFAGDGIRSSADIRCSSATDLSGFQAESIDLVITDPPFGGLIHYSELSDFFFVWLRLALQDTYPDVFRGELTPKSLEAVANRARHREDSDEFYKKLLTASWTEAFRILKPGGLLAFTFHHSEDAPWVAVLESLFEAGFYLECTYPLRSDTSMDSGQFGSKKIEYDIIHVCRKRLTEPKSISWAKMRKQVLNDVRLIQDMLEHHSKAGLPEADLQVIRRGKALEYFSKHYGKVYKDQDSVMTVIEALIGINQLLDEEASGPKDTPPHNAEPYTRLFLRMFDGINKLPRDQVQKFLRGTGTTPDDFVNRGWVYEESRVYHVVSPLAIAQSWAGRLRKGMISDYDQAMFLVGACFEGSGINASDTLNNPNFTPHAALGAVLSWLSSHGPGAQEQNATKRAQQLYRIWESKNEAKANQLSLFDRLGEEGA